MVEDKDKKRLEEKAKERGFSVKFDDEKIEFKKEKGFDEKPAPKKKAKPDPVMELVKDVVNTNKKILEKMDQNNVVQMNPIDSWSEIKVKVTRHESGKYAGTIDSFTLMKVSH